MISKKLDIKEKHIKMVLLTLKFVKMDNILQHPHLIVVAIYGHIKMDKLQKLEH